MSAPETNIEKQKKRHRGPLIGLAIAAVFVVLILGYYIVNLVAQGSNPEGADVLIDGRTGETGQVESSAPASN